MHNRKKITTQYSNPATRAKPKQTHPMVTFHTQPHTRRHQIQPISDWITNWIQFYSQLSYLYLRSVSSASVTFPDPVLCDVFSCLVLRVLLKKHFVHRVEKSVFPQRNPSFWTALRAASAVRISRAPSSFASQWPIP